MTFVLTVIIQFSIWTLSNFQEIIHLACMWLEIRDNLHAPNARWLAYCEGVELLSCSHPVDHTSIFLIFYVNLLAKGLFWDIKHDILLCIPSFNGHNKKIN